MALRDISDIALNTLMLYLSDQSGIPSGKFWFQFPNDDFVNERTKQSVDFPFVGMYECDKPKTEYMNYGCITIGAVNLDGTYTTYFPLGRKTMTIQIDIWCASQADRRLYKNIFENALLSAKNLATSGDVVEEWIDLNYKEYALSEDKPFIATFWIDVVGSIFREENAYLIDTITVRSRIGEELAIGTSILTSGADWLTITSGGMTISGEPSL